MIYDSLAYIEKYRGISRKLDQAIDYLIHTTLDGVEGRIEIDGDNIFANVMHYDPKPLEEGIYEAHKRYIDIQVVLKGKEWLYHAPIQDVKCTMPYNEEKDNAFYEGEPKSRYVLEEGKFIICMPNDAHMPGITYGVDDLKKIVIKVRTE